MSSGQYTIRVHGVLDETRIRQQIAAIQKEMGTMAICGKGKGKGLNGEISSEKVRQT